MHWKSYVIASVLALLSISPKADTLSQKLLKAPDTEAKYLVYMHGKLVDERQPGYEESYDAVIQALGDLGFTVATEIRPENTLRQFPEDHLKYAKHVAKSVKKLIARGVPAKNIFVTGHSTGGMLTMISSGLINNAKVSYVVMAGCPAADGAYKEDISVFQKRFSPTLRGRFLSIIDVGDKDFGSCENYFIKSKSLKEAQEISIKTRQGHYAFHEPRWEWLDPLRSWANID